MKSKPVKRSTARKIKPVHRWGWIEDNKIFEVHEERMASSFISLTCLPTSQYKELCKELRELQRLRDSNWDLYMDCCKKYNDLALKYHKK